MFLTTGLWTSLSHFTAAETEAHRGKAICPKLTTSQWQRPRASAPCHCPCSSFHRAGPLAPYGLSAPRCAQRAPKYWPQASQFSPASSGLSGPSEGSSVGAVRTHRPLVASGSLTFLRCCSPGEGVQIRCTFQLLPSPVQLSASITSSLTPQIVPLFKALRIAYVNLETNLKTT